MNFPEVFTMIYPSCSGCEWKNWIYYRKVALNKKIIACKERGLDLINLKFISMKIKFDLRILRLCYIGINFIKAWDSVTYNIENTQIAVISLVGYQTAQIRDLIQTVFQRVNDVEHIQFRIDYGKLL